MNDELEIHQLVLGERQARDRGWWTQMAAAFHPASRVKVSWFDGSGPDFVAQSKVMAVTVPPTSHRMSPPIVRVRDDRAVAEAPAVIETRVTVSGVEVDLGSRVRLVYRLRNHDRRWLIDDLDCIYESDTLAPVRPGIPIDLNTAKLRRFRTPYRYLAYYLDSQGRAAGDDLFGVDRPDVVASFYADTIEWLGVPPPWGRSASVE